MTFYIADVSEFQGDVNWAAYGSQNPAVIVRAHNGWRADNKFAQNLAGARAHTQWRGFYQYLPASVDPATAAKAFIATIGAIQPGEVVILDLEEGQGNQDARRQAWLDAITEPTEWTYSGLAFARAHLPGVRVDWIAAYQNNEPTDAHTLWQSTDKHSFAGIASPCDGSIYDGTLQDLQKLSGAKVTSAPAHATTQTKASDANPALVKQIQTALHITADGKWGAGTDGTAAQVIRQDKKDVKSLQAHVGATPDGVWGPNSQAAWLNTIKRLQALVGASPDGVWGKISQAHWDAVRVKNFGKF